MYPNVTNVSRHEDIIMTFTLSLAHGWVSLSLFLGAEISEMIIQWPSWIVFAYPPRV